MTGDHVGASELRSRVALVTGGGRGMGLAIALGLGKRGATVAINDIDPDLVAAGVNACTAEGIAAHGAVADVTHKAQVDGMFADLAELGGVDIVVNNAGILRPTPFIEIPEDEWREVLDVNLHGTFLVTQAALPSMIEKGWGRIVNMSSTAGKNVSTIGGAHYTTAKAAILGLTRAVANEVADDGVTVNAVCPGLFDTDMMRSTISPEQAKAYAASFPIHRLGKPSEVADLVAFLASEQAAYITGAALDINGGDLMV